MLLVSGLKNACRMEGGVFFVLDIQEQLKAAHEARTLFEQQLHATITWEIEQVSSCEERIIKTSAGDTRVLIYVPKSDIMSPYPAYVHFHGGGFILGRAEMDDFFCRVVTNDAGCLVVNVDYHLAPEHKFPTAVEEGYDVVKWLHNNAHLLNIRPDRIAVGGFSAGGNIATAVCLLAKERKEFSLVYQVLGYPPLDLCTDPFKKRIMPGKSMLTPEMAALFNACYLRSEEDARNPLVSPVLAQDLREMPAACVITAEYDMLADEGEQYAKKLKEAGVPVVYRSYRGCDHGFTATGPEEAARDAFSLICNELRKAFAG